MASRSLSYKMAKHTLREIIEEEFDSMLKRLKPEVAEIANFVIEEKEIQNRILLTQDEVAK